MKGILKGIVVFMLLLSACDSGTDCTRTVSQSEIEDVDADQLAIDNQIIDDYIADHSLGSIEEVNGIKYILTKEGSGVIPCIENNVVVAYTGKFLSGGKVFDKNASGVAFPLSGLIVGWKLVLPTFTKGTKATLFIPSGYGYGPNGFPSAGIPANANLIFDIELINVR